MDSISKGPRLGTITSIAAAAHCDINARAQRFELQSVARRVMREERVGFCLRCMRSGASHVYVKMGARGRAYYHNLVRCGSVWMCPWCAAQVAEVRRKELREAIERWEMMGGKVLLVTYTARHCSHDQLEAQVDGMVSACRGMTRNRAYRRLREDYGVQFQIRGLEVTWSEGDGWHPHFHVLLFVRGGDVAVNALRGRLLEVWKAEAARYGLVVGDRHGVRVDAADAWVSAYVSKFGRDDAPREWGPAEELSQWHRKRGSWKGDGELHMTPYDFLRWVLETGEALPAQLFREYCEVFKGRKQLTWSRGMREALGMGAEVPDEELVEDPENADVVLAMLTPEEWRLVRFFGVRAQVLDYAEMGGAEAVRGLLDDLAGRYAGDAHKWETVEVR